MHETQRVADMANEVPARQAVTRAVRTRERFKTALEASSRPRLAGGSGGCGAGRSATRGRKRRAT